MPYRIDNEVKIEPCRPKMGHFQIQKFSRRRWPKGCRSVRAVEAPMALLCLGNRAMDKNKLPSPQPTEGEVRNGEGEEGCYAWEDDRVEAALHGGAQGVVDRGGGMMASTEQHRVSRPRGEHILSSPMGG